MTHLLNKHKPQTDSPLDPGIKEVVLILRSEGVETVESCEGGEGHPYKEPTIIFHGNPYEGFRAYTIVKNHGYLIDSLAYEYIESDGWLKGPYWRLVLAKLDRK